VGISQRKRVTRTTLSSAPLSIKLAKPRNLALRAASLGQVKLATVKHQKSKSAQRQAEKMAIKKVINSALKE
jgi:hypothetical protein